jgi:hypothetical protein
MEQADLDSKGILADAHRRTKNKKTQQAINDDKASKRIKEAKNACTQRSTVRGRERLKFKQTQTSAVYRPINVIQYEISPGQCLTSP